jgi:hypothetical protein
MLRPRAAPHVLVRRRSLRAAECGRRGRAGENREGSVSGMVR